MNGLSNYKNTMGYGNSSITPSYNTFNPQFQPIQPTMTNSMTSIGNVQQTMLPGRVVKSERDIGIGEVPMDGMVHLFPTEDYSYIYAKVWDNNGELRNFTFVQEEVAPKEIEAKVVPYNQQEILDMFNDRFNDLERLIKRNNHKPYNKNYKKPYNKNNQNGSSNREDSE